MRVRFCREDDHGTWNQPARSRRSAAHQAGLFCDGEGLWLQVSIAADGQRRNRSWVFRYTRAGRTREMGLGSLNTISLVEARERARKCRQLLLDGIDPIEQRNAERAAKVIEDAKSITFENAAAQYTLGAMRSMPGNGPTACASTSSPYSESCRWR
jgi:hypothetical protein